VVEQVLNLTDQEKMRIALALQENLKPENRVYRYNFFYDNCSTRPRNMIENNLDEEVVYAEHPGYRPSFRQMIHEMNAHHPWGALGNDLLLGFKADRQTTQREQHFLPYHLMKDFDYAKVLTDGKLRPLVKERRTIVAGQHQEVEPEFPLSPVQCVLLLAVLFVVVLVWEIRHGRCLLLFDSALMLVMGLAGCLLFVMLFSEHPTTGTNLQIFLLNPLHLFFIRSIWRREAGNRYWTIVLTMVCFFLLGSQVQDYAEGTEILALCLLSRYWSHRRIEQ
jgi:hypothetical protein